MTDGDRSPQVVSTTDEPLRGARTAPTIVHLLLQLTVVLAVVAVLVSGSAFASIMHWRRRPQPTAAPRRVTPALSTARVRPWSIPCRPA
jgi:hypothetical protein